MSVVLTAIAALETHNRVKGVARAALLFLSNLAHDRTNCASLMRVVPVVTATLQVGMGAPCDFGFCLNMGSGVGAQL
jgi:hypothetical protein